jgi:dynamin 1-like protein
VNSRARPRRRFHTTTFVGITAHEQTGTRETVPLQQPIGAELIPTINKLQEIFALVGTELNLPQIVVVGGQSSGKSSVLENLVGRDFLPRGTDIVTRRPLILQLMRHSDPMEKNEWGEFLHRSGKKFFDFDEIRKEIELETERVAGRNKGISPEPILLKIFSPNVINLTLVDTPGITRVPVGDQPGNIEELVRALVKKYIINPNAILLAVHAANQDLATSDALKLAREVDPEGNRTLGVLTKLDLMDKGTDAMNILLGRHIPLKYGWIGVVNRSQRDIQQKKPIAQALKDEKEFFARHPLYSSLGDRIGSQYLAARCNELLTEHIRKTLPTLQTQIKERIQQRKKELASYGDDITTADTPKAKGMLVLSIINKFVAAFRNAIDGTPQEVGTQELNIGARIRFIFHDVFLQNLNKLNSSMILSPQEIRTALRNAVGTRPSLFVPDSAFEILAKKQIEVLREPAIQCAEVVHNELVKMIGTINSQELNRFPQLRLRILETTTTMLRKMLKSTTALIEQIVQLELSYINTNHPDFVGVSQLLGEKEKDKQDAEIEAFLRKQHQQSEQHKDESGFFSFLFGTSKPKSEQTKHKQTSAASSSSQQQQSFSASKESSTDTPPFNFAEKISEHELKQIKIIRTLLNSYFEISKKNIHDFTVKAIMMGLVNNAQENIQKELINALYKEELYSELLKEADDIATKRKLCAEELKALKEAKEVLQKAELQFDWK